MTHGRLIRIHLFRLLALVLILSGTGWSGDAKPTRLLRTVRTFPAAEAHQGVAVDEQHFYAVTNRAIGKYNKQTGKVVKQWKAPDDSPLRHLNGGTIVDGRLYAAHSNWPAKPLRNSIEIWDADSLEHVDRHAFDVDEGALTWIDYRNGQWWGVFAFYGKADSVRRTAFLQFDEKWNRKQEWRFPQDVIDRFVPYSSSGGSFGPNGLLYVTGHDRAELYALRIPKTGKTLELVDTVPMEIEGQGIAWDRSDVGIVYGIRRKSKEVVVSRMSHSSEFDALKLPVRWVRDERNPVLPPGKSGPFDAARCMNPWVLRIGDEYQLYYSGGDAKGHQRLYLATAPVDDVSNWTRRGPLLENGPAGSFDARWCVLPHVVQVAPDRWHLYYTGNAGRGSGLSAFPGIGLATSTDGRTWTKHKGSPVLLRSGQHGDPDAIGMAGGSVLKVKLVDGQTEWRFYYTGCPTIGSPLPLNQQKTICLAVSSDAIRWKKQGAVLYRDPNRTYENIGVAGPVVHQTDNGEFRMWYSAIGTKWGYYSICYAESDDGIHWRRGPKVGDNLQLTPQGSGWERQMVEYPSVIAEGKRLRLFYCGNGYGQSGIGTAVSAGPE